MQNAKCKSSEENRKTIEGRFLSFRPLDFCILHFVFCISGCLRALVFARRSSDLFARPGHPAARGLKIHRLRLNRHLPKVDLIADHDARAQPDFALPRRRGFPEDRRPDARDPAWLAVFPAAAHGPFLHRRRRPQTALPRARFRPAKNALPTARRVDEVLVRTLTLLDLKRVRQELSLLTRWRTGHEDVEPREAAAVLRLIDLFFRALGFLAADDRTARRRATCLQKRAPRARPARGAAPSRLDRARPAGRVSSRLSQPHAQASLCGLTLGELSQRCPAPDRATPPGTGAAGVRSRGGNGVRRSQLLFTLVSRADRLHADGLAGGWRSSIVPALHGPTRKVRQAAKEEKIRDKGFFYPFLSAPWRLGGICARNFAGDSTEKKSVLC